MKKKVIVLGASENPSRYSNKAFNKLLEKGFYPILIGAMEGEINEVPIRMEWPEDSDIYAITVYLSAMNQAAYYNDILSQQFSKVIFNPGSENKELLDKCYDKNIHAIEACS